MTAFSGGLPLVHPGVSRVVGKRNVAAGGKRIVLLLRDLAFDLLEAKAEKRERALNTGTDSRGCSGLALTAPVFADVWWPGGRAAVWLPGLLFVAPDKLKESRHNISR